MSMMVSSDVVCLQIFQCPHGLAIFLCFSSDGNIVSDFIDICCFNIRIPAVYYEGHSSKVILINHFVLELYI